MLKYLNTRGIFPVLAAASMLGLAPEPPQSDTPTNGVGHLSIQDLQSVQADTKRVLDRITSATVSIRSGYGSGSGAIIREDGLILTAAHVVGVPDEQLMITLADGRVLSARVLGCDHDKDIALAIILEGGIYPFVELADTTIPGQWCLALGHPGGRQPDRSSVLRVSRVSRVSRVFDHDIMKHPGLGIQTSASLISGDSGGPLFDLEGRLIGVHRAISALQGEHSFHAPVDDVHQRMNELLARQEFGQYIMDRLKSPDASSLDTPIEAANTTKEMSTTHVVQDLSELPAHIREMIESGETQLVKSTVTSKTQPSTDSD